MMAPDAPEIVIPLPPAPISLVHEVRSTLLASSLQALREMGLYDQYVAALPQAFHGPILHTLSPTWLTIEMALEHYRTLDSLALSPSTVMNIGRSVGDKLHGTFLGTIARGARHAGVTPWAVLSKLDRVWARVFVGGGVGIDKLGPKEARIAVRGLPLVSCQYFRHGICGVLEGGIQLFTRKCYSRLVDARAYTTSLDFQLSWA